MAAKIFPNILCLSKHFVSLCLSKHFVWKEFEKWELASLDISWVCLCS